MDEFAFIEKLLAPLATEKGALGLKDDAAVLQVPEGMELVVTKDAIVAGVHFIGDEPADLIARKLLAVNLSDLAAMGAAPWGYFLALMLPAATSEEWLADFAQGLRQAGETYGITLMGGDTTRMPGPLSMSVTALGLVPKGKGLLRSGAKPGDGIYVSGTIGDAALGLKVAQGLLSTNAFLLSRYQCPSPRVKLGQALRGIATACMDISDGLAQDLGHICAASGVGACVEWRDVPLSDEIHDWLIAQPDFRELILAGGDDYELLFTAPPGAEAQVLRVIRETEVQLTRIGVVTSEAGVKVFDAKGCGINLTRVGYKHF